MVRLGFLNGAPKVLRTNDYNIISNYDGYFITIKILEVNKKLDFPLLSVTDNKTGSKNYTNDIKGLNFEVDKIMLEDLIMFHDIKFEIVNGYYFDEGRNNKLGDVIKKLFNNRLILKKDENKAQLIYKELLNSIYGKTILKPIETESMIMNDDEKTQNYIIRNYNWIKSVEKIYNSNKLKIIVYIPISDHFNSPHIGGEILSMSKRIMNEVMITAQDNNIKIYYQDTDSMHIEDNQVNKLIEVYKLKYNRDLEGKNMGQFHCDFEMKDHENIKSIRSIFLGKKCYIDVLEGTHIETGLKNIEYHIRLKGVGDKPIIHYSKINNINPYDIFKELFNNKSLTFDLTSSGLISKFKQQKNFSIVTLKNFSRTVSFKDNKFNVE
jgi:hypothetical protein